MTPSKVSMEKAREIIEGLIEYDQWRDNLHVNDFSWTKHAIAQALDTQRKEVVEECAKVCDEMATSLDNEWNRKINKADDLVETAKECADAIRLLSTELDEGGKRG